MNFLSRIKGITIELDGETKGLNKALEDVDKKSRDVSRELRQVERLLKFNPGNTELITQKQQLLAEQVDTTRERLNRLKDAQEEVNEAYKRGEISEQQYREFQRELIETESKLKHFESQLKETKYTLDDFGADVEKAGESVRKAGDKMVDTGKSLSTKVTAPLMGVAGVAAKVGMDYEAGMSKVAAVSGATGDDLKKLEDKAREMGAATSFSATEAANGLEYMALAGWDTEQMLDGIGPVLTLAEAGALDLGRASDLVTDSMAGLGLEVNDLDEYLDKVAKTAASSNTDIDALMEAMVVAGGTFDRLNVPLEESNAFLGVLANRGFKGSQAGTAMNAIMSRLTQSTGPAAEALKEIGVSAFDSEGNFRGMETVLTDVQKEMNSMTDAEREHYQTQLAGLNHGKTFNAMLSGLGDEYQSLKGDIVDSDGALQEMRDTMKDNLQGRMEEMKSALEETAIILYDNLKPAIETIVEWITKAAEWFQNLSPTMQNTIIVIAGIAAAIGPLLIILGMMTKGIGTVMIVVGKLIPLLGALGKAFIFLATNPIGLIIVAIAALIAIGVAVYKNWDKIKEWLLKIWGYLKTGAKAVFGWILDFLKKWGPAVLVVLGGPLVWLVALFVKHFDKIKETIMKALEWVLDFFQGIFDKIFDIIWRFLDWFNNATNGAFEDIVFSIKRIFNNIYEIFEFAFEFIKETVSNALDFLKALFTLNFEGMKDAIKSQFENIKMIIDVIWTDIKGIFEAVWDIIIGIFTKALDWINDKTGGIFTAMIDTIKTAFNTIKDVIFTALEFVKNTFKNAFKFLKSLVTLDFKGMKDAISNQMKNVKDTIKNIWNSVMDFFKGIDLKQIGIDIIKGLIGGIKNMAKATVDAVKGVVGGAINGAKKLLGIKSPSRVFMEIGEFSGEGLEKGLKSMGGRVEKASDQIISTMIPDEPPRPNNNHGGGNSSAQTVTIVVENMNVRNDEDIVKISRELERLSRLKKTARGDV